MIKVLGESNLTKFILVDEARSQPKYLKMLREITFLAQSKQSKTLILVFDKTKEVLGNQVKQIILANSLTTTELEALGFEGDNPRFEELVNTYQGRVGEG